MKSKVQSTGAFALVSGGIGAAFTLAACCAVPIILGGMGLTAYWLAPVAIWGERFGAILTAAAILALTGSVFIVWRAARNCEPRSLCARLWYRIAITALACIGVVLLILSKLYA